MAPGSAEEHFYRDQHLENNTFADSDGGGGGFLARHQQQQQHPEGRGGGEDTVAVGGGGPGGEGDERFVAGEEVRVILVHIGDIRTSDWKGGVRDWVLVPGGEEGSNGAAASADASTPVNGVR